MLIGRVWICRLLFVCKFVRLRISPRQTLHDGSWASWAWNLPFWGTLLLQKPKIRRIGARFQNVLFQKGTVSKGRVSGHPLDTSMPPLGGCWPKNRDVRSIKSRFYQSQNAPKLAFLSSKIEKIFWGVGYTPPPSAPRSLCLRRATRLVPSALDLGASIRPPSHTFWIRL